MRTAPFAPLVLAKAFGVSLEDVAFRLRVSRDWLRKLAQDPRYAQRVQVAELEVILEEARQRLVQEGGQALAGAAHEE
jgi:hypothetical protein